MKKKNLQDDIPKDPQPHRFKEEEKPKNSKT
jgi:hypothetical protein